ncbi:MAG: uroporphyrinogen decarboxylase [Planctomycetota bacterium]
MEHRLIEALWRRPHQGIPVWFMRQAGRYLPGYTKIRKRTEFLDLCKNPELASEVSVEPLELLGVDAVIIFSDILVVLEAMGIPVVFTDRGPFMERPIASAQDIAALGDPDPEQAMGFVMDTIRAVQKRVAGRVPVLGFAGAPWTLACYALEGSPSRTFSTALKMIYHSPRELHSLLEKMATAVARYLRAQVEAGAQAVQLFDTWGGLLADDAFADICLEYCRRVLSELDGCGVPRILFVKGGGQHLEAMADLPVEAIALDYTIDPRRARELIGERVSLQGNLTPEALFAPVEDLRARARRLLGALGDLPGYVFNLGHGILPGTPVEHVRDVVETVHSYSKGD